MLMIFYLIATSLLLILVTKTNKNRTNETRDLISIHDFFKHASEQSSDEQVRSSVVAIQHLNSIIHLQSDVDEDNRLLIIELTMLALKSYPDNDKIILLSLTLSSLLANNDAVIQKIIWKDSNYLQVIIGTMQSSLSRAKAIDEPLEHDERLSAEIQRRGCLFLGGFSDDADAVKQIIDLGGINAVIEALQWYRFHAGVCKWGLWAVFHMCYDRQELQTYFVAKDGIQILCECIKNNSCADVTRHGIAILFDIMKYNNETALQAKMISFREGLHDILVESMNDYPEDKEISMMCQQILGGVKTLVPQ